MKYLDTFVLNHQFICYFYNYDKDLKFKTYMMIHRLNIDQFIYSKARSSPYDRTMD